jgi:hypothetical protein
MNRGRFLWALRLLTVSLAFLCSASQSRATVINGDFEQGNTGFSSSYNFQPRLDSGGPFGGDTAYAINTRPTNVHSIVDQDFGDHTTGTGQMLLVNSFGTETVPFWVQTVNVGTNTDYEFGAFVRSWSGPPTPPNFFALSVPQLRVNGQVISSTTAPTTIWTRLAGQWNSGSNTTATLSLYESGVRQDLQGGFGMGVDDISFTAVVPEPSSLLVLAGLASGILMRGRSRFRRKSAHRLPLCGLSEGRV